MAETYPIFSLLAALLLAAPAGLNPYLPLLMAAAMARFSSFYQPMAPLGFLGATWFLVLAAALFLANTLLDKYYRPGESLVVPRAQRNRRLWVGAFHDLGQMLLGPAAGALLAGATSRFFPSSWPLVAPMLGALAAGLVYVAKRALRRRLATRWGAFSNMLLSVFEDIAVVAFCLTGLLLLR
jgi:hypothetical protein